MLEGIPLVKLTYCPYNAITQEVGCLIYGLRALLQMQKKRWQ